MHRDLPAAVDGCSGADRGALATRPAQSGSSVRTPSERSVVLEKASGSRVGCSEALCG